MSNEFLRMLYPASKGEDPNINPPRIEEGTVGVEPTKDESHSLAPHRLASHPLTSIALVLLGVVLGAVSVGLYAKHQVVAIEVYAQQFAYVDGIFDLASGISDDQQFVIEAACRHLPRAKAAPAFFDWRPVRASMGDLLNACEAGKLFIKPSPLIPEQH